MTEPAASLIELFRLNHTPDDIQMVEHTKEFVQAMVQNEKIRTDAAKAAIRR